MLIIMKKYLLWKYIMENPVLALAAPQSFSYPTDWCKKVTWGEELCQLVGL